MFFNISWNIFFFKSEHLAKISILCSNNLMPSNNLRKPRNGMSQRRLPHWTLLEHLSIICLKYYRLHHTLPISFWQETYYYFYLIWLYCKNHAWKMHIMVLHLLMCYFLLFSVDGCKFRSNRNACLLFLDVSLNGSYQILYLNVYNAFSWFINHRNSFSQANQSC